MSAYNDQKLKEYQQAYDDLFARYLVLENRYRIESETTESLTTIVRLLLGKGVAWLTTADATATRDALHRLVQTRMIH